MKLEDENKTEVLINLLNERYNASHEMRRRSTQFVIWLLGFVLVANGWLIVNGSKLTIGENILITIFISALGGIALLFIRGIQKGFGNNMDLLIKLENIVGCYDIGAYKENEMLYPKEYKENDGINWSGHFETLYMLVVGTYLITIILIWI